MKLLYTLVASALLCGCATPMPTASGRPEVTIAAPVEKIRAAITDELVNHGYSPRPGDMFNLVFEKDAGMAASIFLGSTLDPTVIKRVRFTLIQHDESCRVVGGFAILSASTPRESETPGRSYSDIQLMLDRARAICLGEPMPPLPPPAPVASSPRGKGR